MGLEEAIFAEGKFATDNLAVRVFLNQENAQVINKLCGTLYYIPTEKTKEALQLIANNRENLSIAIDKIFDKYNPSCRIRTNEYSFYRAPIDILNKYFPHTTFIKKRGNELE